MKFAQTVFTSGNDLLQLINEILDLSKVEAGKMPIDPHTFSLAQVRDYLEQTFRHVADQKGLAFEIRMGRQLPEHVFSDVNRLQQILKNLLSNAFKFTATGGVTLTVQRAAREHGEGVLAFAVRDTGIGIPVEKQKLVFEAFQQADGTTSRKYGGTGLGLTISREIARLLGGAIEVVSAPGDGQHLHAPSPGSVRRGRGDRFARTTAGRPSRRGRRSPRFRKTRTSLASRCSSSTTTCETSSPSSRRSRSAASRVLHADNGKVAIDLLQQHDDVDLVLMDTMMPEMDGLSATRAIRERVRYRSLPIISLTAKAMKGDREKALEAGATDYVTKPVDSQRLLAVVHYWVTQARAARTS